MNQSHNTVDMLHGKLLSKIIFFALPIALSSMLQQLFNAADTAVVGQFADANALAAVGTNGEIVALFVTLSAGLSVGANVLLSRFIGEGKEDKIPAALHTALVLAILCGCTLLAAGQLLAAPLLRWIQTPAEVLSSALLYLRIYLIGIPFLMLYDFGSAILRAKGNSRSPFIALTLSGILNVLLNLFFVIVCHLGVAGVAIATDLSTAFSAGLVHWTLAKETDVFHFSMHQLTLQKDYCKHILKIGIPSAVQGAVFCFANIFVQASVNSFGAVATAGSTIAMNFEYFGYFMITAFGQAATTFTSQNHAAGEYTRCKKVLRICLICAVLFSAAITAPFCIFRTTASGIFTHDAQVVAAACERIMLILVFEPLCCFYEVPAGALRGSGYSTQPAIVTILGTCLLRIVWIFTVFQHFHRLSTLFIVFPISWVVTTIAMWICYLRRCMQR